MFAHTTTRTSVLALACVVANGATETLAQIGPIVSGPGGPGGPPQVFPVPQDPATGEFNFGSPANRAVVQYQTGAGAFEKLLTIESDQNMDGAIDLLDLNLFLSNPVIRLNEYLTVGPGPAWTDWHEMILTPDWEWGSATLATPNAPTALTNLTTSLMPQQVDFFFDPLAPGTDVDIAKDLFFTGNLTPQLQQDFLAGELTVRVSEYPTSVPEPGAACMALLVAVTAAAIGMRARLG